MDLKEFDKTDWYAFAGAERFKEPDSDPLIGEGKNYFLIADAQGMEIHLNPEAEDDGTIWQMEASHTPAFYRLLVSSFQETLGEAFLTTMGFKKLEV